MSVSSSASEEQDLQSRVAKALELRDLGEANWLELSCEGAPQKRGQVRRAVAAADALPLALSQAFGADPHLGAVCDGRYRIQRRLGAGAMGVVYEAEDLTLGRPVALKLLRTGLFQHARALERFDREARALAMVAHPSVVTIHDRGVTPEGASYLVMELIPGRELGSLVDALADAVALASEVDARILERGLGTSVPDRETYVRLVARWGAEIAAALASAHAAGVIHRDIKPSNILVRDSGRAVLLDFGIAYLAETEHLTQAGSSVGTPAYTDPELLDPTARASAQSDVYGLGAVLYSLLALQPPYTGTPPAILHALATRDPVALLRRDPNLPRDLVAIVEKSMSRRSRDRYTSAVEMEQDLRAFLDHRPTLARPLGPIVRSWRRLSRSATVRTVAGTVLVLGVLLLGRFLYEQRRSHRYSEWLAVQANFPPNFTIVAPQHRQFVDERDRRDLEALLDRAAELAVDPLPTFLLRASFRMDHGDTEGAAADMRVIANHVDTPLARALAQAYASVAPGSRGSKVVPLGDLPAARTIEDRYLRAYHHLRAFEDAEALALLEGEVSEAIPHAEELRFALVELERFEPLERKQRALDLHTDVRQLENRLGIRTATTAHFGAYALASANAYQNALDLAVEGIELAPRSHVNRTTAGWVAFALGSYEQAREILGVAMDLRPNDRKPLNNMVMTHVAEREFEAAHRLLRARCAEIEKLFPPWTEETAAEIEVYRALYGWTSSADRKVVDANILDAIARARHHLERAEELGSDSKSTFVPQVLDALEARDEQALFEALAIEFRTEVRRLWRLPILRLSFPEQLEPGPTAALRELIQALEREVAGSPVLLPAER